MYISSCFSLLVYIVLLRSLCIHRLASAVHTMATINMLGDRGTGEVSLLHYIVRNAESAVGWKNQSAHPEEIEADLSQRRVSVMTNFHVARHHV